MSLGQQLAPHLPFLRRFGRSLTGTQAQADAYVRQTLLGIVGDPASFPRDVDPRLGLYRMFLTTVETPTPSDPTDSSPSEPAAGDAGAQIYDDARRALLLTAMEGFNQADAAYIIGRRVEEIDELVAEALRKIERPPRAKILIVEDEPIISMDLETIVRELGHEVIGVASEQDDAVLQARQGRPDIVLMDIQLRGEGSGIDAAKTILSGQKTVPIFITAFPERLLTGDRVEPTFLITKPFQRSTVKAAITQALFFDGMFEEEMELSNDTLEETGDKPIDVEESFGEEPSVSAAEAIKHLADNDLAQKSAPIFTQLVGAMLTRVSQPPIRSPIPIQPLERLRIEHLATADRLCASTQADNLGMAFTTRLVALRNALRSPIDEALGLTLGVQAQGLRSMLPTVHEQLSPDTATDIDVFIGDVFKIATQFPNYQQFTFEAAINGEHTPEQRTALARASKFFENQPDELVAPNVKADLAAVRINAEDRPDEVADLAFERAIGNVLKSYGSFLLDRLSGVRSNIWQTFDKASGGTIGVILAVLFVALPVLMLLQAAFPGPFAFLLSIMKLVKAVIP